MRQSQCDRHKVKMMDVFGPLLPVGLAGCCISPFSKAALGEVMQQKRGRCLVNANEPDGLVRLVGGKVEGREVLVVGGEARRIPLSFGKR